MLIVALDFDTDGIIDEFGVWNSALDATDIATLYNSGSGRSYPFTDSGTTYAYAGTGYTNPHAAAKSKIGFVPAFSIEEGIKDALASGLL